MSFEQRLIGALQKLGDMAGWVPPWLWWLAGGLVVVLVVAAAMQMGWKLVVVVVKFIDAVNERVGRATSWVMLFLVVVTFVSVVFRYLFDTGWIWMADLIQWPHGMAFMLAAGYTLLHEGHVRVDIFYSNASPRKKAWTDLIGTAVFLLPWVIYVAWVMFPAVAFSWKFLEASANPGGLPARYIVKASVAVFTVLLGAQGLALAGRSVLVLVGRDDLIKLAPQPDKAH